MSQMSDALENAIVDHCFRTATFAKPAALTIALYTAAPSDAGGGTEVSGGSYARAALAPSNANWLGTHGNNTGASSGTGGQTKNSAAITYPAPTADWGTITHFAIFLDGMFAIWGAFSAAKVVSNGDQAPAIAINGLTVTWA